MLKPSEINYFLTDHITIILSSYRLLLGKSLLPEDLPLTEAAKQLFYAPFAVLSHNTSADPIFNYANGNALELFGFEWDEFIQLPSRFSAEAIHQSKRDELLAEVNRQGYISDYQGIRITKSGQRFLIKNAVVWNLADANGYYAGQAACFSEWQFL